MKTKLVVFGITGDLSRKKLLPALRDIKKAGELEDLNIIGVSRRSVSAAKVLEGFDSLVGQTSMFKMDLETAEDYQQLKNHLDLGSDEQLLIYLSVPPSSAIQIVELMGQAGINGDNVKLLLEKPFGLDLISAQDMIEKTGKYFKESQLYRIDHYMAKEVASEVLRLRLAASNHHHAWGSHNVLSIDIIASEKIGVEDRTVFYEQTGALRDVLQGHLMQLLALVLMPAPIDFNMQDLPEYRLEALNRIKIADSRHSYRAQYFGYREEVGNEGSLVETYASVVLESKDPNWRVVPIKLVTGKKLDKKRVQIVIRYRDDSVDIFDEADVRKDKKLPDAYERVIVDAINSRRSIFTSSDEVLKSWEILQPIISSWEMTKTIDVYGVGSTIQAVEKPKD